MRDAPASIETMLEGAELTLARCVKIQLRDGTEFGFTDLDENVSVPLADVDISSSLYEAGLGLIGGDIDLTVGLEADTSEIKIPISARVTKNAVLGRRFNQADIWFFDIDHSEASPEAMELMQGRITESRLEGNLAVFEVRSASDLWNVTIGGILTPRCRADYGDRQCGKEKIDVYASVSAVESAMRFTITFDDPGSYDDQYFRFGEVEFWDDPLYGVAPLEVLQSSAAGLVELVEPLPEAPQIGMELSIRQGCSRLKRSTDPTIPTCHSHLNLAPNGGLRFRGFDRVPGSDVYLKMPIPGTA